MMKGMEHLLYKEKWRELRLINLEKKRLTGNFVSVFQYLMGGSKECKVRLFSVFPHVQTRGNRHKLKYKNSI